jgi:hypothetical protein
MRIWENSSSVDIVRWTPSFKKHAQLELGTLKTSQKKLKPRRSIKKGYDKNFISDEREPCGQHPAPLQINGGQLMMQR